MSEHWYDRQGNPAYEIRAKSGLFRPTTLSDARKLALVPSVTTILGVLAKPALVNWMVDQGIMAALTLPRIAGESEAAFLARVKEDSKAQAKAAAEEGTRIHDACETGTKGGRVPLQYVPHVEGAQAELRRLFPGVNDWVAERSFCAEEGYGGKVDIHSPSTGLTGDYKGKEGDFTDGKRLAYDQHWQLAPYNRGLCLPRAEGFNIFVSRTHPGKVASHVWSVADMEEGWRVFQAALQVWKAMRKYDPSYTTQQAA